MLVMSGADVFCDVGVLVTGDSGLSVVWFTDGEEERSVVTCRQLDDVSDQSRRTQTEHMHTWGENTGNTEVLYTPVQQVFNRGGNF